MPRARCSRAAPLRSALRAARAELLGRAARWDDAVARRLVPWGAGRYVGCAPADGRRLEWPVGPSRCPAAGRLFADELSEECGRDAVFRGRPWGLWPTPSDRAGRAASPSILVGRCELLAAARALANGAVRGRIAGKGDTPAGCCARGRACGVSGRAVSRFACEFRGVSCAMVPSSMQDQLTSPSSISSKGGNARKRRGTAGIPMSPRSLPSGILAGSRVPPETSRQAPGRAACRQESAQRTALVAETSRLAGRERKTPANGRGDASLPGEKRAAARLPSGILAGFRAPPETSRQAPGRAACRQENGRCRQPG